MARFGGMSSESFSSARERLSSASSGLGSLLRDQKAATGANRMHILLGLSSSLASAAGASHIIHSLSSSPVMDSNDFLYMDDIEIKDEDIWGLDINEGKPSHPSDPLRRHRLLHAYELSSPYSQTISFSNHEDGTHNLMHSVNRKHVNVPKHRENSMLAGGVHSAYHLVADESSNMPISSSDAVSAKSAFTQLPSVLNHSERSQVAHQVLAYSRQIPRSDKRFLHGSYLQVEHQSAPLNVPNWSKVLRNHATNEFNNFEDVGEEDDEERLPPHEILAREYAQKERMTFSVCEGQGRTLKGRDMRRVRNAVWRQIGFAD